MHWLLTIRIDRASFLVPLTVAAAAATIYLLSRRPWGRGPLLCALTALAGALTGLLVGWLVSDVWNVFGLPLTMATRGWVAAAFAGVFLGAANLPRARWRRRLIAIAFLPLVAVAAAAGINLDYGAYRTLADALGIPDVPSLAAPHQSGRNTAMDPQLGTHWQPPRGMPAHGTVGAVTIPGAASRFDARRAVVYLPPAAQVADPPTLPVVVLFPGQPGSPSDVFTSGRVAATYDAYAATHHGLAPIVVAPDQLGAPLRNPMCLNSPLGNVATYITVDVPAWVRAHFRVADSARYWAVGGFSQGGTCAFQFGTGYPQVFGSFVAVLSELQPTIGPDSVSKAFGGSVAAYDAEKPLQLMARHAPYTDSAAIVGTGALDAAFTRYAQDLSAAARRAGISTRYIIAPASGHDWNTVRFVYAIALPELADRMGLSR
jgi:enterochelin esterase-like enzyme